MNNPLDKLRAHAPQPDAGFAQQLEDQLIAELGQMRNTSEKESAMLNQPSLTLQRRQQVRRAFVSPLMLTAAAALLIVIGVWALSVLGWRGNNRIALGPTQTNLAIYPTLAPDNVTELQEVGTLGNGAVYQAAYSPDGATLALAGTRGVWLYDTGDLTAEPRLLASPQPATAITYSADGSRIASGHQTGQVLIWDAATGEQVSDVRGNYDRINALAFSPDGTLLATASGSGNQNNGNQVQVWDTVNGAELWVYDAFQFPVWAVSFDPDGEILMMDSGNTLRFIQLKDIEAGTIYAFERSQAQPSAPDAAFIQSGFGVVFSEGSQLHFLHVRKTLSGELDLQDGGAISIGNFETVEGQIGHISSVTTTPNQNTVITSTVAGSIMTVDVAQRNVSIIREADGKQLFYTAASEIQVAALSSTGEVFVIDLTTGETLATINHFDYIVSDVMALADNQLMSVGVSDVVRRWDMVTEVEHMTYTLPLNPLYDIAVSPSGNTLAYTMRTEMATFPSTGVVGDSYLRNLETGDEIRFGNATIKDVTFSPDETQVAGVASEWSLYLAEAESGFIRQIWDDDREEYWSSPAFNPDGTLLAAGGRDRVSIFDTTTGELVHEIALGDDETLVTGVWYSPDGTQLLVKLQPVRHIEYSRSDSATYADIEPLQENVRLWLLDADSGEVIHDLTRAAPNGDLTLYRTMEAQFSPDGKLILTQVSVQFGTMELNLWNTETGERLAVPALENQDMLSATFTTDGNLIATGGWDGLIHLFGVTE
jgi:WD40 repeat protein